MAASVIVIQVVSPTNATNGYVDAVTRKPILYLELELSKILVFITSDPAKNRRLFKLKYSYIAWVFLLGIKVIFFTQGSARSARDHRN